MNRNDMRRVYGTYHGAQPNTVLVLAMCDDREGNFLTDKTNIDQHGQAVDPSIIGVVEKAVSELQNCVAVRKNRSEQLYPLIHRVLLKVGGWRSTYLLVG